MKMRKFMALVLAISTCAMLACAAPQAADDDDDDDGVSPTPTPSSTATATPTPTSTPATQDITPQSSFIGAGGAELWLCIRSQFAGTIDNIATDDGGTCSTTLTNLGLESNPDSPTFHVVLFEGVTGCGVGTHDWYIDYLEDDGRCPEGCVNQEFLFAQDASGAFGDFCGPTGGSFPITSLSAYLSQTTGQHRFTATVGPASVKIETLRIYDQGGGTRQTICGAAANIEPNGTGLFDTTCEDPVTLTPGVTYSAMVSGTVGGDTAFLGRIDFDYVNTPAPQ